MNLLIGLVAGYTLAQFVSLSKLRGWVVTFRKDGTGDSDDWPGSA